MKTAFASPETTQRPSAPSQETLSFDALLAPVFETAQDSSSLLASRQLLEVGERTVELPHFLLLGQRGGGTPVRVALFGGLDAGRAETVHAVSRLLLQYELAPRLATDFAVFAYPIVNATGFGESRMPLGVFERRLADDRGGDVRFFKHELGKWGFDGLITLRVDDAAEGFHAVHRSAVIGREVLEPALRAIAPSLPLRSPARTFRPGDPLARVDEIAQGKLAAFAAGPPYPFEIEVYAPGAVSFEERISGLFLIVQEILRGYRRMIAHAADL
jgi:hypothetical protein